MDNGVISDEADSKRSINGNSNGHIIDDVADSTKDTDSLLTGSVNTEALSPSHPSTRISLRTRCCGPARLRYITVEPAMVLFVIAFGTMVNLKGQYIRQQIALKYGESSDPGQSQCSNVTDEDDIDKKIQAEASEWTTYLSVTESIPSLFAVIFFGAISDRFGRKPLMLIPVTGMVITCLSHLLTMSLGLPLYMFYISAIIRGSTGGVSLFMALCFSYIADITTEQNRMFRIVIIDMIFYMGAGASQIGVGFFLKWAGYVPPMLMAEFISVLAFFYVIAPWFIPPSISNGKRRGQDNPKEKKKHSRGDVLRKIMVLFQDRTNNRRRILIISCMVVFSLTPLAFSQLTLTALYALGEPFCWTSVTLGLFMAVDLTIGGLGTLIGAKVLSFCMSDIHIVIVAILDSMLGLAVTAVARDTAMLFIACIVSFMRGLMIPVFKASMSKLFKENEQGTLFACFGSIQGLSSLVAPFLTTAVYGATVKYFPQFVFYYLIVLLMIPLCLICLLIYLVKSTKEKAPQIMAQPDHAPDIDNNTVPKPIIN